MRKADETLVTTLKDLYSEQIENYKNIDGLVLVSELYRLSDPFESNYFCEIIVSAPGLGI